MKQKRPIVVIGNNAYVTLTKGYLAVIDTDDVSLIASYNWCALVTKTTVYAVRREKGQMFFMHRELLKPAPDRKVDHKDTNGLNNRRKNLREATHQENMFNTRKKSRKSTNEKGVTFLKSRQKWKAQIMLDGKNKWLGDFATKEQAVAAYAEASNLHHKEFSRLQ